MNKKKFREDAFQTIRDLISDEIPLNEMKNQLENTYPEGISAITEIDFKGILK